MGALIAVAVLLGPLALIRARWFICDARAATVEVAVDLDPDLWEWDVAPLPEPV